MPATDAQNARIIEALTAAYWGELETVMNYIANSEHLDEDALAACVTRNSMIGTQRTLAAPG